MESALHHISQVELKKLFYEFRRNLDIELQFGNLHGMVVYNGTNYVPEDKCILDNARKAELVLETAFIKTLSATKAG